MKIRLPHALALLCLLSLAGSRPALAAAGAIRVSVSPEVLLADGISSATVTAAVQTSSGRPARDGTEVRFYTTAGTITQVAFTSAGVARATLTSSAVPQAANISVAVGIDQAIVTVPMVSKLVETSVGGRVMRVTGQYVAFSEDKRFIQADGQVTVRYRGVEIQANSAQVDLTADTVKAIGKVQAACDDKTLVGDRLWLDLRSFEGYMQAVGTRQWFSAYGLTELPERPKNLNPDFDLVDLSDSKLLWVGKQANYIVDERVQIQGARAYVAGIKSIRMPFHQVDLQGGFMQDAQYVGVGSQGLTLDLPLYVRMTPGSSTAVRVGYGSQTGGIGHFTRNNGLNVDLVQKYGFTGASEGQASLTNLADFGGWGFQWNHTQQVNKTTRLVADLQFPEHRDVYANTSLTAGLPLGTLTGSVGGQMLHNQPFTKNLALGFETKPKPVADGAVGLSVATSFMYRDPQQVRLLPGLGDNNQGPRVAVPGLQYEAIALKATPKQVVLAKGLTFDNSVSLQQVFGGANPGFGPALESSIQKQLPKNGLVKVGFGYNQLASANQLVPNQGLLNANLSANWAPTKRLKLSYLGTMALDAQSRNSIFQVSYQLAPKWRVDALHSLFQFGQFGQFDYQLGIARAIGSREMAVYWSHQEHKFLFQFGASRF